MLFFDLFFNFDFPFFNLLKLSFMALWWDSIIDKLFLCFISFDFCLFFYFLLIEFSFIVEFLNLILQN